MVSWLGRIRHRLLTPNASQALLHKRGFPERGLHAKTCLEMAGSSFIDGFGVAAQSSTAAEAAATLRRFDGQRQGFAFEGAAMAMAVRDALPLGHRHHVRDLLEVADDHSYMIYVGVGWSLARLPQSLRRGALGGLTDPVLTWLTMDGYGFHQAFFHTGKYVRWQYIEPDPPQPDVGHPDYVSRAVDQGIGRALWFVGGADPEHVLSLINSFSKQRHEDLFAGVGLAATYAGGATPCELEGLAQRAGEYQAALAQGSVFAAEARARAQIQQPHTELAVRAMTGLGVPEAAAIATRSRPSGHTVDGQVSFEVWRRRIMRCCIAGPSLSGDWLVHEGSRPEPVAAPEAGDHIAASEGQPGPKPFQPDGAGVQEGP